MAEILIADDDINIVCLLRLTLPENYENLKTNCTRGACCGIRMKRPGQYFVGANTRRDGQHHDAGFTNYALTHWKPLFFRGESTQAA
jgi:hypothetical protein